MTTPEHDPVMADQLKPPLWRVLSDALPTAGSTAQRDIYAAEIRALADWLVPEESSETFLPGEDSHNRSKRQQRRHLRATLLIEAVKAEVGE
jgi:hypothetical protein